MGSKPSAGQAPTQQNVSPRNKGPTKSPMNNSSIKPSAPNDRKSPAPTGGRRLVAAASVGNQGKQPETSPASQPNLRMATSVIDSVVQGAITNIKSR